MWGSSDDLTADADADAPTRSSPTSAKKATKDSTLAAAVATVWCYSVVVVVVPLGLKKGGEKKSRAFEDIYP